MQICHVTLFIRVRMFNIFQERELTTDFAPQIDPRQLTLSSFFVDPIVTLLLLIRTGNPTKVLLQDRFLQICVLLWVLVFWIILYL